MGLLVQLDSLNKVFDSFYVTDSPLCVTNSTNGNVLFKLTSVNDDLTVYMLQIVLYVLLT